MNYYDAMLQLGVSVQDLSALTGFHRNTVKKMVHDTEEYRSSPQGYRLSIIHRILRNLQSSEFVGQHRRPYGRSRFDSAEARMEALRHIVEAGAMKKDDEIDPLV